MNKKLQKEAKKYANVKSAQFYVGYTSSYIDTFIAGANSIYVREEKIKAQIKEIQIFIKCYKLTDGVEEDLMLKINQLKKELKSLV